MAGSLTKQGGLTGGLSKPETLKGNLANPHLRGYSAYEVAVENGFEGTEEEWLESLKGQDFTYEDFTEEQLDSLKGDKGDPFVYDDFTDEQLELLKVKGDTGKSAYEVWLDEGNKGTEQDFLNSLKGETNITSKSIADVLGYVPADVNDVDNLSKDVEKLKEKEVDLTGYATENYVQSYAQPKGDYAALKHTHSEYLTEHQDLKDYAKKSDIPTDYAKSEHEHDQYLTSIPDEYVTESELADKKYLTSIPSEYITESKLNSKGYLTEHQSLTDYAKKTELPTKTSQLENDSGFLTKDDNVVVDLSEYSTTKENDAKYQPKGDYSTVGHTHNEYLTENELSQKGYATESFVTNKIEEAELSGSDVDLSGLATKDELNNKVDKIKGKSLIDDTEIERLAKVINYDDTEIKSQIDSKADKTEIPSKVSQLENDKNYLTSVPNEYITETELNNKGYLTEHQDLTDYAKKVDIPTDYAPKEHEHSQYLTEVPTEYITETELNSKGYLTQHQSLSDYAKKTELPTKVSQLENDSKYLTSIPNEYITETELANKKYLTSVPSEYITESELNAKGYLTQHQSLTDYAKKTELPTKTSQLTNDSGFLTQHQSLANYYTKTETYSKSEVDTKTSELSREIVNQQTEINNLKNKEVDLTGYATEEYVDNKIDGLPNNEALVQKVAQKVPYVKVAEHPICVNSIAEMTDTSKMYVLNSDGMFYSYKTKEITTEGSVTPNFTNVMDNPSSYVKTKSRYSQSGGSWKTYDSGDSIVIPYDQNGGTHIIRVRGAVKDTGYTYMYFGASDGAFTGGLNGSFSTDSNGDIVYTASHSAVTTGYITFTVQPIANVSNLIITIDEEITYTIVEGGTQVIEEWSSTGISYNQPADYEARVIAMETDVEELEQKTITLSNKVGVVEERLDNVSISGSSDVFSTPAYAPIPQLPADGSTNSDFHGLNNTTEQAYDYMEVLANKYKGYVTKQIMGKDQSGAYDHNRYVLCKAYYRAWLKPNYPMMFAWKNGSTIIYSVSTSPRVGDTMYSTPYIGTVYKTVTSVNHSTPIATSGIAGTPSTRTVNGLVFERYKDGDIEPTIVYTKVEKSISALNSGTVYDSDFNSLTNVTAYTKEAITCANGIVYTRYPFEDRKADKSKPLSIFILANEHGHHGDNKVPSIILMRMAKDLCENKENPFLQWLKENTMITMIPVGNPWGYDPSVGSSGAGYYNSRGVNINRNYDTPGWAGSDTNYGDVSTFGEYAGSENETQHIMNTMHLCKAKVGLSMHGLGLGQYKTTPTEYTDGLMWQGCGFDKNRMTKVAEVLFSDYGQLIGGHTSGDQSYEYCGKSPAYIQYVGAVGGLNEIPDYETGTLDLYTPTVMESAYTQMLLFLQTWIQEALEKMN